jgi:UrcA family protein
MRDVIEARVWNKHREAFPARVDRGLRSALKGAVRALRRLPEQARHGLLMGAALAASVTTLTLAGTAPAMAAEIQVTAPSPTVTVSYSDLDIRTAGGAQRLHGRVRQAARQLCQPDIAGLPAERSSRRSCFRTAAARGRLQVDQAVAAVRRNQFAQTRTLTVTGR